MSLALYSDDPLNTIIELFHVIRHHIVFLLRRQVNEIRYMLVDRIYRNGCIQFILVNELVVVEDEKSSQIFIYIDKLSFAVLRRMNFGYVFST